jgi:hypothetical protein
MAEQTRKNVLVREKDTLGVDLWPVGSFWQIYATYFASSIIRALLIMQALVSKSASSVDQLHLLNLNFMGNHLEYLSELEATFIDVGGGLGGG